MLLFWKEATLEKNKKLEEKQLAEKFPELWKYVEPKEVTDVDYNCGNLWISKTNEPTKQIYDEKITESYMRNVANSIALNSGRKFNATDNILCVDTDTLRVTCVHDTVSNGMISVCLRKEIAELRFTMEEAIKDGFCDEKTFNMLINCVLTGYNFTFCGTPGTGKTETLKNLSSYIPKADKVICIEDVSEIHYAQINPDHNCVEVKVGTNGYERCITDALRMNPQWIMFGEALGKNSQYLLECWSNGVLTMSTLHVSDARNIPDKIVNNLGIKTDTERIMNQIHNDVGIAVLMKKKTEENKLKRYIDQVCFYYRVDGMNGKSLVVEDGILYPERIPDFVKDKVMKETGRYIFSSNMEEQ